MNIRNYTNIDYSMLESWAAECGQPFPEGFSLPEDSTFILENDGHDLIALSAYLTNTKEVAYIENFIGNPAYKGERKEFGKVLWDYVAKFIKDNGYKRVATMTHIDKLKPKYMLYGYRPTISNVMCFVKEEI